MMIRTTFAAALALLGASCTAPSPYRGPLTPGEERAACAAARARDGADARALPLAPCFRSGPSVLPRRAGGHH